MRDERGRFVPGTCGGPGNPNAKRVSEWRQALVEAVSKEDLVEVIKRLVVAAKAGEPWAVREVLDRCLGKPRVQIAVEAGDAPLKTYVNVDVDAVCGTGVWSDPAVRAAVSEYDKRQSRNSEVQIEEVSDKDDAPLPSR